MYERVNFYILNLGFNRVQISENRFKEINHENADEDIEIEIIEVEEPEEPVPMQDSCLQVSVDDIFYYFEGVLISVNSNLLLR